MIIVFLNDIDEIEYGKKVFRQVLDEIRNEIPQYSEYISQWEDELQAVEQGKIQYLKPVSPAENGAIHGIRCTSENFHYYLALNSSFNSRKRFQSTFQDVG